MCTAKAGTLQNPKKAGFVLPFSMVFCLIQLSLLISLNVYSQQRYLTFRYHHLSSTFSSMEEASRKMILELIELRGPENTYQYLQEHPSYYWDLTGTSAFDALTVFSAINLRSDGIEWVSAQYALSESYAQIPDLPLFEMRLSSQSSRRVKMVPYEFVLDAKALHLYRYNLSDGDLHITKISIPTNETH